MAQAHSIQAAAFNPLRHLLFITLFAVPLLALANPPTSAAAKVKSGQVKALPVLASESGQPDLLLEHTPHGHAWGFQALSTADGPAPIKFSESVVEVSEPSATGAPISPVPEPSSYVLMLAGLAAVGYIVSRRSQG